MPIVVADDISTKWLVLASVAFLIKHLVADFFLQTGWMARNKEGAIGWAWPLAVHASIHGAASAAIFLVLLPSLAWLAIVDFVVHFAIDRTKGVATRRLETNPSQSPFWWLIGVDQTLHHLTDLAFVVVIASARTAV